MKTVVKKNITQRAARAVSAGAIACVVAGVGTVGAPAASAAPVNGCTEYMAYLVPGTTETNENANPMQPAGMLSKVGNALKGKFGDDITVVYVPYSASAFDKGKTYAQSAASGVKNLSSWMSKCKDSKIVLSGYSQGAEVAGDVAWHIGRGNGPVPASSVRAVALLADPKRGNEKLVGNVTQGQGVEGERPGGYGSLEGRIKWVCDTEDMYCNTTSKNPFVGVLGKVITGNDGKSVKPLDGEIGDQGDMASLVSDFGDTDLTGLSDKTSELSNRLQALNRDGSAPTGDQLNKIASLATDLNQTYSSTADIKKFADDNGVTEQLGQAKSGTPDNQTAQVLDALGGMDLNSLISNTASIAQTASGLASGDLSSGNLSGGGEAIKSLATMGMEVASQSGALNSVDSSNLAAATGVLGKLKVSSVVDTALTGVSTVLTTDFQGIIDKVTVLGQQLTALDAKAAHVTAGELNNMMAPWVELADMANTSLMPMAADMVGMIPDPQGYALIASQVMKVIGQVDIKRLADNVGKAQEVAWGVVEGHPEQLVNLAPIALDLGTVGLQSVTSGLLGTSANKTGVSAAGELNLGGLSTQLTSALGDGGVDLNDLSQLVNDGIDFSSFLASGAHTSAYTTKSLIGDMSAVEYIAEYFAVQLGNRSSGSSDGSSGSSGGSGNSGSGSRSDSDDSDSSSSGGSDDMGDMDDDSSGPDRGSIRMVPEE